MGLLLFGIGVFALFTFGSDFLTLGLSRPFPVESLKIKAGDDLSWKETGISEEGWQTSFSGIGEKYWCRMKIRLDERSKPVNGPLGLGVRSVLGAYEVYWDGHLIGRNGVIGDNKDDETPGGIDGVFLIPEMLSGEGLHVLSLRISQFRITNRVAYPFIKISDYDVQSRTLIIIAAFMHILAGLFLGISVYYFLVYLKSFRRIPFLIFGGICLLLFLWILLEYVRFYYAYPYHFHYVRLDLISAFVFSVALLLLVYFLFQFDLPKKGWIAGGFIIFMLATWYLESDYDRTTWYWMTASALMSTIISGWAWYWRKPYSLEGLISVIALLIAGAFFVPFYYDRLLFLSFTIFVVVNLYTLSKMLGEERRAFELSLYQAERLKIELLKKNIQPHYLMNTLTALISWVEESPKTAQQFIQALAEEFEALRQVSEKSLIPVQEEVELCNAHLEVMKYRNELNYELKTFGIDPSEQIPPAIFLTLLENGLTHNHIKNENAIFKLTFTKKDAQKIYRFFAPGEPVETEPDQTKGTGLKYVEARLKENYAQNWTMQSNRAKGGWETVIILNPGK